MITLTIALLSIYGPAAQKEGVIVAKGKDFKEHVLDEPGPVAVQFFTPCCGHCKALKPAWKAATKALKGEVKLVVVDATSEQRLAQKYSVGGYPTILFFQAGAKRSPAKYEGGRDASSLTSGLRGMAKGGASGAKAKSKSTSGGTGSDGGRAKPKPGGGGGGWGGGWGGGSSVVELTDATFREQVIESDALWLVAFYAPWCGHCKSLEPEWKQAAMRLKGQVSLGSVDATAAEGVARENQVEGYPTIKVVHRGETTAYDGGRTAEDLVGFAMEKLETLGVDAEVPQFTSAKQFAERCDRSGALCGKG